jgi:predicted negative regulator of RcsB-dependent stress response
MVDEYLDEREQAEQLKQWFKENWLWMVAGIGLGLGSLYGWQGYNAYLDGKSQDAGQRFAAMLQAFDSADLAKGREIGSEIISKYASTPYADQTIMVIARVDAETEQFDDAAAKLRQVMEQSKDQELALVARIRLARVQLAQGKQDDALATLEGANAPAIEAAVAELRGDALLAKGDAAAALTAYQQSLAANASAGEPALVDAELLQLKIDKLSATGAAPKTGS